MCASVRELLCAAREAERLAEAEKSPTRRSALTRRARELRSAVRAKLSYCVELLFGTPVRVGLRGVQMSREELSLLSRAVIRRVAVRDEEERLRYLRWLNHAIGADVEPPRLTVPLGVAVPDLERLAEVIGSRTRATA